MWITLPIFHFSLVKDYRKRPKYKKLLVSAKFSQCRILNRLLYFLMLKAINTLMMFCHAFQEHNFIQRYSVANVNVGQWFQDMTAQMEPWTPSPISPGFYGFTSSTSWKVSQLSTRTLNKSLSRATTLGTIVQAMGYAVPGMHWSCKEILRGYQGKRSIIYLPTHIINHLSWAFVTIV